jgi:hypothetical protein
VFTLKQKLVELNLVGIIKKPIEGKVKKDKIMMKIQKAVKRYFQNGYRMAAGQKRKKNIKLKKFLKKLNPFK